MDVNPDSVPLFSRADPVPDIYTVPPLTTCSAAAFRLKLPLVQKMDRILERHVALHKSGHPWFGKGAKRMTSWVLGLLYTMSADALTSMVEDWESELASVVCDNAKEFILLCSGNAKMRHRHEGRDPNVSWIPMIDTSNDMTRRKPYQAVCAISGKTGAARHTYIVPFSVTSSTGALELFLNLRYIIILQFGIHVCERITMLLTCPENAAATTWNTLLLDPYLSVFFDSGHLALRPLAISRRPGPDGGGDAHAVHFSVHWLPETNTYGNAYVRPDKALIEHMLRPSRAAAATAATFADNGGAQACGSNVAATDRRVAEGKEASVVHDTYESAENTFVLMVFRWTMSMALCLAGGIAMDWVDVDTDEEEEDEEVSGLSDLSLEDLRRRKRSARGHQV